MRNLRKKTPVLTLLNCGFQVAKLAEKSFFCGKGTEKNSRPIQLFSVQMPSGKLNLLLLIYPFPTTKQPYIMVNIFKKCRKSNQKEEQTSAYNLNTTKKNPCKQLINTAKIRIFAL